jgi:hypothetical protein
MTSYRTNVAEIEGLTALHVVDGYVWCSKHGEVHSDTLNPRGYTNRPDNDFCKPSDHEALFMDSEHHVPYVPSGTVDPEPVRSIPVPLTVRRHTEQSRAIFLGNLMAALPVDMLDEDKERIATILLDTAIAHGDEIRRKRIIDKLMEAAEYLEDRATLPNKKNWPEGKFQEWSDLMADAAEEIRSFM